tara:strand:+ start:495 stop:686 length:192 start_codon:yes stop_codon:yes gene_type:complete
MVKKIKLDAKNIALLAALGFAWSKLGLGAAFTDFGSMVRTTPLKPDGSCPAGWIKHENKCIKL